MKRTSTIPLLALAALIAVTPACGSAEPTAAPEATEPVATAAVTEAADPTDTPEPIDTPEPTATVEPTDTPVPTATAEPTVIPEPVTLTGTGDSVVDVGDWECVPGLVHIVGNAGSDHFAVKNFDVDGEKLELLVNTTDPYDGWRPLDWMDDECTTRFQVQGAGEWSITLLPLAPIPEVKRHWIGLPGTYKGEGDDVIILAGSKTPDLANVSGNDSEDYFGVMAWVSSRGSDQLLVNTTDPYEGTVILDPTTFAIEVRAVGAWTVEVTTK